MDDDGLMPEALERGAGAAAAGGERAKFLYTVPNFHNPAGVTSRPSGAAEIVAISPSGTTC